MCLPLLPAYALRHVQILFSFPKERAPAPEVANMCFPHGVQPHLLQRTPSMTALNQFFCGQQFSHADTHSFVFFSKVCITGSPFYKRRAGSLRSVI